MSSHLVQRLWGACALLALACTPNESPDLPVLAMEAVRDTEDARGSGPDGIGPIESGIAFPHPVVRHGAVRAAGRLERSDLIRLIEPALTDSVQAVRVEAVNAVGQAAKTAGWPAAFEVIARHLPRESDSVVRAVYGQTLGRLPYDDAESHRAAETHLMELLGEPAAGPDAEPARLLALARGFESLARLGRPLRALEPDTRTALAALAGHGLGAEAGEEPAAPRIRRTALMAYLAAGPAPDPAVVERSLLDPDDEVRRIAARGLGALPHSDARLRAALADPAPRVRWEAVRVAAALRSRLGCDAVLTATEDADEHVRLLAIDLLSEPCPAPGAQLRRLLELTAAPPDGPWHAFAHATVALAALAPQEAASAVRTLSSDPSPFARAYAAPAAAHRGDRALLEVLASDPEPNVREAAIRSLARLEGHGVDGILLDQLESEDPQLVRTAAQLLEGSPLGDETAPALLVALARFTEARRETSRDVRLALLDRVAELGTPERAAELRPYLRDFDARVAERAAEILTEWDGVVVVADAQPLPRAPVPPLAEIERLSRSTVILEVGAGAEIAIRLFAGLAPTNAARFARLAEQGYFDGLTFHRVAPNFVIQGGSPGANEYWGDAPYTRDELGLVANWRGTVGLSTRGRDTGDGQIYVNLVDNLRLDHDYTVFGEVVRGMELVDRIQEGAVIRSARVVEDPQV